jgi:murein DD-endopeptidase MepM/ murein hydrolase activator NlpD
MAPTAKPAPEAKIAAGMVIPVKGGKWAADGGAMVTLGDGESLSTLADRYGVPETALRKINGFSPKAKPIPGTRLLVPVFISDTAVNLKTRTQQDQAQMQSVPALAPQTPKQQNTPPNGTVASLGSAATNVVDATSEAEAPTVAAEQAGVEKTIATTGFRWPARGRIIASFGETNGVKNAGINIALPQGTPVKAAESGVVAYAGNEVKGQGNLVMIRHADGWVSIYANNSELKVKRGDEVKRGQVVALSGQTGDVPSPQLHFELRKGSMPVDPVAHLSDD